MYGSGAVRNPRAIPVTPEGHCRLTKLLTELPSAGRAEVSARLRDARDDGGSPADSRELMDALEEQIRLERGVAELDSRLARAAVVDGGHVSRRRGQARRSRARLAGASRIEADPGGQPA